MDNIQPDNDAFIVNSSNDALILTSAYPNLKSLTRLFFVLIFFMLIGGIIGGFLFLDSKHLGSEAIKPLINLILYIGFMLLTIRYGIKKAKKNQPTPFNIRFNKIPFWLIPVLILTTIALVVGLEWVSNLIPMPDSVRNFFEKVSTKNFFSIITLVIAAPILEEILCRGIVLKGLLKNYAPNKAILISALFFGLIHLNPWQALPAFFGGLFLGWAYYKTQSVIPGMIIHATINGTSVLFLFLPYQRQQSFSTLLGEPFYILICALSALVFIMGCWLINRKAVSMSD
ncbi:lysostaphin resistance A-like protein [Mucilaginibacter angelicae]|uniref:Lysostaphin resistance A-like protein n=1 Tax=Mucilaginibacter angelicae TaxID=869718 RepID=A0ABV6L964_9SPHI